MASAVSGVRAVYDNEGIDPCKCHVHYCECFINDDDYGLHQDCQKWLEMLPPPHTPSRQYRHNGTGEDSYPERWDRLPMPT